MASFKLKFRPSATQGKAGTLYFQVIHRRSTKLVFTDCHLMPGEWNERTSSLCIGGMPERQAELRLIASKIQWDTKQLKSLIAEKERAMVEYTVDDIVLAFRRAPQYQTWFSFIRNMTEKKVRIGRHGTAKTYRDALVSFTRFRNGKDMDINALNVEIINQYEAWLKERGVRRNSSSCYMRTLRTYLDLHLNAVATAKALFIHRSTLLYRLDKIKALLVGGDADQDLAVLKIDAQGLTPAEFGVSDELSVGDPVYAIGNPLGLELRSTFTDGIVSAVNRDVDVDGVIMTLIQTNAALNSGNSGGPLINQYGQVVGINTIKMMSGYDTLEGLGFAIPTSLAQRWVNELIEYGELQPQPLLGLTISRIPEVLDGELTGLRVEEVSPGLGGEAAGVEVGDYILSFNGQEITRIEQILSIRQTLSVGDMVEIQVWRDGEILTLTMEMMAGE